MGFLDYACHIQPVLQDLAENSPLVLLQGRLAQVIINVRGSPDVMNREYMSRLQDIFDFVRQAQPAQLVAEEALARDEARREEEEAERREEDRVRQEEGKRERHRETRRRKAVEDELARRVLQKQEDALAYELKQAEKQELRRREKQVEAAAGTKATKKSKCKVKDSAKVQRELQEVVEVAKTAEKVAQEEAERRRRLKKELLDLREAKRLREEEKVREEQEEVLLLLLLL
jgi:hypothetical protein